MSDGTTIEWSRHPVTGLGASWNPLLVRRRDTGKVGYHCEHVTEACRHCYAETFNKRNLPARGTGLEFKPGHRKNLEVFVDDEALMLPLKWKEPRGIFVCSMTDLFGEWVDTHLIDKIFGIMALAPQHVFFVLTKRPDAAARYANGSTRMLPERRIYNTVLRPLEQRLLIAKAKAPPWPLPNVWLGTSVEDQTTAEKRIPQLLSATAALHWISAEPLLGPINLRRLKWAADADTYLNALSGTHYSERLISQADLSADWHSHPPNPVALPGRYRRGLRWIVAGGESGPGARPTHPDWIRQLRDDCGILADFFFKQWGAWVDADQIAARNNADDAGAYIVRNGERWRPTLPLNFSDAAFLGEVIGRKPVHQSDGRTLFRMTKENAGRLLDGVEHDEIPGQVAP